MNPLLEVIEVETKPHPEWAVIWMHGLGADGNDFVPVVSELGLADAPGVRFVFPHAEMIPVTCNNGYVMRAWYDILELNAISRKVDEAGIRKSRDAVRALIERENQRGIPTERIFLAGFSQGGAMVYSTGLTHPDTLAGLIALSTYIPSAALLNAETHPANNTTPVFAAHGLQDPIVPFALGEAAKNRVTQTSRTVDWHSYKMPHSVCIDEIEAIGAWLKARMHG
ncbi:alpha/beta hydrolase [Chitinimonas sp. BJB300]|uniref:alpha/beta hydrolase n=1 Tax=Chitinimonas sp. BJB300 TaxID=1559339 RepID=UPI000C0C77CE|nr:alpha/beta hydrolase [Chitinimonas sp. BJB300]PHV11567.1 carboxylesterase [Chitinimonas sp. BJB300]TSJ88975.1 alpha/beta hydrolase [Chitinimonas sp. BJB300]